MIRKILFLITYVFLFSCSTKPPTVITPAETIKKEEPPSVKKIYRSAYTKFVDLIHTRLNVSFNWKKKELIGNAAIILRPHFYSTDSLILNAKGMELNEVSLLSSYGKHIPLKYDYDSLNLKIHLGRVYSKDESLTIFIRYISRPDDLKEGGSEAITEDKGLYFINADSLDPETPTQLWTQGETESNSCWFPTIEDPAQKMTQEVYITVDTGFTTLSNGLFISSVNNKDGTKTDYWKQSLPAAPYLTMIAAGKFSVVKDKWKNIEVNYYVDPPYEKYASMIFGNTPEMLTFFSEKTGIPFVWEKFSQVVVHDYISGAMENTTAVVHGTNMQQNSHEYKDGNFEDYISHELFHHWFGDLITCRSWSNITLNEGFANYGEYLWREYKFGHDNADQLNQNDQADYLYYSKTNDQPLIRYQYNNREDMYDPISYNKGGRVLHMLRNYVGDSAFFASLKDYLSSHLFSSAEITDLRFSFEKITGEDLNWFFNQWFMEGGHPSIEIINDWNDSLKVATININQIQNPATNPIYKLPLAVDIYYEGKVERKKITADESSQVFTFHLPVKPDLVNVDADKTLLCEKTENKSDKELIFQYSHAPLYLDRFEAVSKIGIKYKVNTPAADMMAAALHDKSYKIRQVVIENIGELAMNDSIKIKSELIRLAETDSSSDVRENALRAIGKYFSYPLNANYFLDALKDSSYKVVARAFKIISEHDSAKAKEIAPELEKDSGSAVLSRLSEFYSSSTEDKTGFYKYALHHSKRYVRYSIIKNFDEYLSASSNTSVISKGIDILSDQLNRPASKRFKSALLNSLRSIESSLKKKINDFEEQQNNKKTNLSGSTIKDIDEMKSLRNKLHDKITSLDK